MRKRFAVMALISLVMILLDQVTKHFAIVDLKGQLPIDLINGFMQLRYVENPGASWGFLANTSASFRMPFFIIVTIIAVVFIIYFFWKLDTKSKMMMLALSLILSGAIGNFIDRVRFNYVVDFVHCYYRSFHWPTFNVADAAISVGVGLMILAILLGEGNFHDKKILKDGQSGSV